MTEAQIKCNISHLEHRTALENSDRKSSVIHRFCFEIDGQIFEWELSEDEYEDVFWENVCNLHNRFDKRVAEHTGESIWRSLSDELRDMLLGKLENEKVHVSLMLDYGFVPWELIAFAPELKGKELIFSRVFNGWDPPVQVLNGQRRSRKACLLIDQERDEHDGKALEKLLTSHDVEVELVHGPTRQQLVKTLQDCEYDFIHYFGHGDQDLFELDSAAIKSSRGMVKLSKIPRGKLGVRCPIIFFNGCKLGQMQPLLGSTRYAARFSFVRKVMENNGCRGFIAPIWEIDSKVAKELEKDFYANLFTQPETTIAAALNQAQFSSSDYSQSRGYVFYGYPSETVQASAVSRIEKPLMALEKIMEIEQSKATEILTLNQPPWIYYSDAEWLWYIKSLDPEASQEIIDKLAARFDIYKGNNLERSLRSDKIYWIVLTRDGLLKGRGKSSDIMRRLKRIQHHLKTSADSLVLAVLDDADGAIEEIELLAEKKLSLAQIFNDPRSLSSEVVLTDEYGTRMEQTRGPSAIDVQVETFYNLFKRAVESMHTRIGQKHEYTQAELLSNNPEEWSSLAINYLKVLMKSYAAEKREYSHD